MLPSNRAFAIASRLSLVTAILMFGLIVIGSVVRTTGSGLACPDWPLCNGRLIPPFEFHVLIEWTHRLVALGVSLLLGTTAVWTFAHRPLRGRLGGLAALILVLLAAQILLGALTVWKLLDPSIVSGHLAVALLLFSSLLTYSSVADRHAFPDADAPAGPTGHRVVFGMATALVYVQAILGGVVSSRHAGLACPDWPGCDGQLFPPLEGLVGIQMTHRYVAYAVLATMVAATLVARSSPDPGVRAGAAMALGLTCAQVVLGICNVLLGTPVWLSALHLATAAALLGMLVGVTCRVAALPVRSASLAAEGAR